MKLDFGASIPIYQQIIDEIKKAIARGELVPGDKLPSQRDLAESAKVNQNTVQRAYRELEIAGLAETLRGQGTFVASNPGSVHVVKDEMAKEALHRFVRDMYSLGFGDNQIIEMVKAECMRLRGNTRPDSKETQTERGEHCD